MHVGKDSLHVGKSAMLYVVPGPVNAGTNKFQDLNIFTIAAVGVEGGFPIRWAAAALCGMSQKSNAVVTRKKHPADMIAERLER
jgi:hypothetical protein